MIHFVLGGARSGKSHYAQELASHYSTVSYVATAIAFDDSMSHRIDHHRRNRPAEWQTIEQWKDFVEPFTTDCILVDCLTLMVTNLLLEGGCDIEQLSMAEIDDLEQRIHQQVNQLIDLSADKVLILVSNEVGLGLSPATALGNVFRDIAGRINQMVAQRADQVVFMVSGLPWLLKEAK